MMAGSERFEVQMQQYHICILANIIQQPYEDVEDDNITQRKTITIAQWNDDRGLKYYFK